MTDSSNQTVGSRTRSIREAPTRDTMYVELDGTLSIDYLWGHSLKLVFDDDAVDVTGYDVDNGAGLAARAIEHLRATGSVTPATA